MSNDPLKNSIELSPRSQSPRLWLGWWWQPDIGAHGYCDLRLTVTGQPGGIGGTFVDFLADGMLTGGIDAEGWVHLRRRTRDGDTFYVGQRIGRAIAGMWIIGCDGWWGRQRWHRNSGLFRIWPLDDQTTEQGLREALPDDPCASWVPVVVRDLRKCGRQVSLLQRRVTDCTDPVVGRVLCRQEEYLRLQMLQALAMPMPVDESPARNDGKHWKQLAAFRDALGESRAQVLFARMGAKALEAYRNWQEQTTCTAF